MGNIKAKCPRCRGKGGRLLAPRTKSRYLSSHKQRVKFGAVNWARCDLCNGDKELVYPHI